MSKKTPKPETPEQTSKRMLKQHGRTLSDYETTLAKQGGGCKLCGQKPVTRRLAWEHDHAVVRVKIKVTRDVDKKYFVATIFGNSFPAALLRDAVAAAKLFRLQKAERGLCCSRCNRGLQMFKDSPAIMRAAANYAEQHRNSLGTEQQRKEMGLQ